MCGLITQRTSAAELQKALGLFVQSAWTPRFLVWPTQQLLVVRATANGWAAVPMRWQLVPSWKMQLNNSDKTWNAMAETVAEKPTFRSAFQSKRCLIPTAGFFEWEKIPIHSSKIYHQPWLIHPANDPLLVMAGLWETWQSPDGSHLESCTVITTTPNPFMTALHHRMPVILGPAEWGLWLDAKSKPAELKRLLRPCPDAWLDKYRVSPQALKGPETAACIQRLDEPPDLGPRQATLF